MRAANIIRDLKPLVPPQAFAPNPWGLVHIAAHAAIIVGGCVVIGHVSSLWLKVLLAFVIGHSQMCAGFMAHYVSHGSVVRGRARYPVELIAWTLAGVSATMWQGQHNRTHHRRTNTREDTFRYFMESERKVATWIYSALFIPNRRFPYNPFILLFNMDHQGRHMMGAITGRRANVVTNLGRYSTFERFRVFFEMLTIVGWNVVLFHLAGSSWRNYLFAGPLSYVVASALSSAYLYTQHSLFALATDNDPLGSTSLVMPRWIDWLHVNQSHHTAHHLFEGLDWTYYPLVTRRLAERHPDALQRLTFSECWRRIRANEMFKPDPVS